MELDCEPADSAICAIGASQSEWMPAVGLRGAQPNRQFGGVVVQVNCELACARLEVAGCSN